MSGRWCTLFVKTAATKIPVTAIKRSTTKLGEPVLIRLLTQLLRATTAIKFPPTVRTAENTPVNGTGRLVASLLTLLVLNLPTNRSETSQKFQLLMSPTKIFMQTTAQFTSVYSAVAAKSFPV